MLPRIFPGLHRPAPAPVAPYARMPASPADAAGTPPTGRPAAADIRPPAGHRAADFAALSAERWSAARARLAVLQLGRGRIAEWKDAAMQACRHAAGAERGELLLAMALHGLTPDDAVAGGLRFPSRMVVPALVALARAHAPGWVAHLAMLCRQHPRIRHCVDGDAAMRRALERGDAEAARALAGAGLGPDVQPWSALRIGARNGELRMLQTAVAAGFCFDRRHRELAEIAAARGDLRYVRYLHDHGMPLDSRMRHNPLLRRAVESGDLALVRYLVGRGAERRFNGTDRIIDRATLMDIAIRRGDVPMASLLLELGYRCSERERIGLRALHGSEARGSQALFA